MKKTVIHLFITISLLFNYVAGNAQLAAQYSFNNSTATYSPLTGGIVLGSSANSNSIFNYIPIGFTFNYLGQNFTDVHILSSGSLKFGAPIIPYQALSSGSLIDNMLTQDTIICGLDCYDLASNPSGVLQYTTTGIAPNRVFTVEWSDYNVSAFSYTENVNFQMKLYETTNRIQTHYGSFALDLVNGTSTQNQLGLRGDFTNLIDLAAAECSAPSGVGSWNNPTITTYTNAYPYCQLDATGGPQTKPSNGRRHTWTPPAACSGTPNAGVAQVYDTSPSYYAYFGGSLPYVVDTACAGTPLFMFLSGSSVSSGLTYQWQTSANNTTWTAIPSATQIALSTTFTASVNTWYRCLVSCGTNTAGSVSHKIVAPTLVTQLTAVNSTVFCLGGPIQVDVFNIGFNSIVSYYNSLLTYTWQTSSNGTSWTSVPTATDVYWNTTYTAPQYFQAIVGCGTNTTLSIPVFVTTYTGAINAGTTIASFTSACASGQAVSINLAGATNTVMGQSYPVNIPGITYQWQSSLTGTSWSAVSGATLNNTNQPILNTIYYQNVLTCGVTSSTSTPISILNTGIPLTFTSAPYLENFDNTWQNGCSGIQNLPNNNFWTSNPSTGNNSWRRQDAGATASWSAATTGTIAPLAGAGCANFHATQASGSGEMKLYINLSGTSSYNLSFYHKNPTGDDYFIVSTSTNGGLTYGSSVFYSSGDYDPLQLNWDKKIINLGVVNSPSCVIKFSAANSIGAGAEDLAMDSLEIKACIPSTTLTASTNTVCLGSSVNLNVIGSATSYSWSTGAITSSISPSPAVATIYTVTTTSTVGCGNNTQTISIGVNPSPSGLNANPSAVCSGSSSVLSLTSTASSYTWSSGANTPSITVSPTVATVYTLSATNSVGCSKTQTVLVGINISPTVSIAGLNSVCSGNTLSLNAFGATNYTWSVGGQTTNAIIDAPTSNTTYSVTGFSGVCSVIATKNVTVNPLPVINIIASPTVCLPTSGLVTLTVSSTGNTFTWQPGGQANSNITAVPQNSVSTTIYSVNATTPLGCKTTQTTSIEVQSCAGIIQNSYANTNINIYPNPTNDVITLNLSQFKAGLKISIYNALSQLVIEQDVKESIVQINCFNLKQGFYQITISDSGKPIYTNKLIKN